MLGSEGIPNGAFSSMIIALQVFVQTFHAASLDRNVQMMENLSGFFNRVAGQLLKENNFEVCSPGDPIFYELVPSTDCIETKFSELGGTKRLSLGMARIILSFLPVPKRNNRYIGWLLK